MPNTIVGSITDKDFHKIYNRLKVTPEKYTKPIRLYCDIDGVVMPIVETAEELKALDGSKQITAPDNRQVGGWSEDIDIIAGRFVYNTYAVEKLSEWSKRDDVDFVWLTAWRQNAPYSLDKVLDIHSVGFLPWAHHNSDYNHAHKGIALLEDQKYNPSKFVWLDDFANKQRYENVPFFTEGSYKYTELPNPDAVYDEFTGSYGPTIFDDGTFVVGEELIDPKQYLSLTTNSFKGLTHKEINLVDEWLKNNS